MKVGLDLPRGAECMIRGAVNVPLHHLLVFKQHPLEDDGTHLYTSISWRCYLFHIAFTIYSIYYVITMLTSNHLQFPKLDPDPQLITARIPHLNTSRLWRLSSRKLRLAGKSRGETFGQRGSVFAFNGMEFWKDFVSIDMYIYIYICVYIYLCICSFIYIYTYIFMYTDFYVSAVLTYLLCLYIWLEPTICSSGSPFSLSFRDQVIDNSHWPPGILELNCKVTSVSWKQEARVRGDEGLLVGTDDLLVLFVLFVLLIIIYLST